MRLRISLILIFQIILTASCNDNSSEREQNFDWLIGNWVRTNNEEEKTTFENWEKQSDSAYIGFSYTMQQNDTVWQENIALIKEEAHWSFNVTGEGEAEPTKFKVVKIGEENFICENQANEFPKKIEYSIKGDFLHAVISGNDMEVLFDFEKIN